MSALHHQTPGYVETLNRERPRAGDLERVVRAAADGDHNAWRSLVERYTTRLRAVARMHRLGAHDAEDVMQTTWLRLLENVRSVRDPRAVGAWLEITARRESLRVIQSGDREQPTDDTDFAEETVPPVAAERLMAAERRATLEATIATLPERQQQLVTLLLAEPPASYSEISRALAMPVGAIGPTRARAFARMRDDEALTSAVE